MERSGQFSNRNGLGKFDHSGYRRSRHSVRGQRRGLSFALLAPSLKNINTYLLEKLLLTNLLKEVNYSERFIYSNNENEIVEYVNENPYNLGIFLNPISVNEVEKVCLEKELLPPKSTYFYPKLLSGLIMRRYN